MISVPRRLLRSIVTLAVATGHLIVCCWPTGDANAAENSDQVLRPEEVYERQIKPLLQEKCVACHGALNSESGLRLDAIQLIRKGGDSGQVITSSDPADSELYQRMASPDAELRMPPEGEGTPLTAAQLRSLRSWISQGAPGPEQEEYLSGPQDHWAFQPIVRPTIDAIGPGQESTIDALISQTHEQHHLTSLGAVDDATWLRRVTLDVIGIPPTVAELQALQQDASPDRRRRVVDRLLTHPSYGQRWGRHWMDVWRYSDWDGYKQELRGSQRHIWHWRDWIVESLNENKPYDQMIVEMLAGDELAPTDQQVLRATGFLARNFHKSNRDIWLDATVEHTGKAFLGLTFNCAKCHDHKYDPIAQRNFYQLRAIFEPHQIRTDPLPGNSDTKQAGIPRAYDAAPDAETFVYQRGDEKRPMKDDPVRPQVVDWIPAEFQVAAVPLPLESYQPSLSPIAIENALAEKREAIAAAQTELQTLLQSMPPKPDVDDATKLSEQTSRLTELRLRSLKLQLAVADEISFTARCSADLAKGHEAGSEQISQLSRAAAQAEHQRKRLAEELTVLEKQQALVAVQTADEPDAKKKEQAIDKAEQELANARKELTELPLELPADSEVYSQVGERLPQASTGRRLGLAKWIVDPQNPLTARVAVNHIWMRHFGRPLVENVFDFGMKSPAPKLLRLLDWLAAEFQQSNWDMKHVHRLILLSEAYARQSSGPATQVAACAAIDPDNALFWKFDVQRLDAEQVRDSLLAVAGELDRCFSGPDIDFELGETVPRRSLYFRHAYEKQMQMMVLFDAASPNECYRRRPSVIPQQALVMINSPLARSMSRRLAARLSAASTDAEFVRELFLVTLTREPMADELSQCVAFLERQAQLLQDEKALTPFVGGASAAFPASSSPQGRARESLAVVMLNHNDFLSVR